MKEEIRKDPNSGEDGDWEDNDKDEKDAESRFRRFQRELKKYGVDLLKAKILEIGTGNNVFLNYMRKQGIDAIGVDARPRGEKSSALVASWIEQLPFRDGTFDVVLSAAVFDSNAYYQYQREMLNEIKRVLKENGFYLGMFNTINIPSVEGLALISDPEEKDLIDVYKKI